MKLLKEEQILDLGFRKKVITEIVATENIIRKEESLRRHEVYRDNTIKWVIESLWKEGLKPETIAMMEQRASNISICRKVINKLARSYMGGVRREAENERAQTFVDELGELLDVDQKMKKADRYRQLQKNAMLQVIPELDSEVQEATPKYKLKLRVLAPWQYDVIEDCYDREQAKVVILNEFTERNNMLIGQVSEDGRSGGLVPNFQSGNRRDEIIADKPEDEGYPKKRYIWWSKKFHFTTDDNGQIINEVSPEDRLNPIQKLPFVNVHDDQDGSFWAMGGQDIVDGSVLINKLITDMFSIAYMQGYGQLVITGKDIPQKLSIGPHHALILNYDDGDPKPEVEFRSANPPLDQWMAAIEQYVALLLSTNDLSPSTVAAKLDAAQFPSGIAMLIEQSEATGSVEDKQKQYMEIERQLWQIVQLWQNLLMDRKALSPEFAEVGMLGEELELSIKFNAVKPAISEKEKLETIQLRKDLGINTAVDLILLDNPGMNEDQAKEKLLDIQAEKLSKVSVAMEQAMDAGLPLQPKPQPEEAELIGAEESLL